MDNTARASHSTSVSTGKRRPSLLALVVIAIIVLLLAALLATVGLAVYTIIEIQTGYANLTPPGWRNATMRGSTSDMRYAISQDDPGLMLACGTLDTEFQSTNLCWRTVDGGAHWKSLNTAPFQQDNSDDSFALVAPRDGNRTFFAVEDNKSAASDYASDPIWITHDAGTSWRHVTTLALDFVGVFDEDSELSNATYRNGRLYALLAPRIENFGTPHLYMAVSMNDGATWTSTERQLSALEKQGWGVDNFAADYRTPNSWFRMLETTSPGVSFEHSTDDGRSWQTISTLTTTPSVGADIGSLGAMSTTPARPGDICAVMQGGLSILASADGGHTWRLGLPTWDVSAWHGYRPTPVRIGSDGSCYTDVDYQILPGSRDSATSDAPYHYTVLQLKPGTTRMTRVPLGEEYENAIGVDDTGFVYVPAGHGMSARLVLHTEVSGVWGFLLGSDASTVDLLIWRSAP